MLSVPFTAAWRTGSGSVKLSDTGAARWAIAVTSGGEIS
jgi:hypothetical protein